MITLLAVTLITLDARDVVVVSSVRDGAVDAVSPVRDGARWVTSPVRNAWNGITGYDELREQNEALRAELAELKGQQLRGAAAEAELRRISEQLDIGYVDDIPTQLARVTAGTFSNFEDHTLQIDRGADSGLEVGNPVVTRQGLVGRIQRVTGTRAVVQLITDPEFRIGVHLPKSNVYGTGQGSGDGRSFIVDRQIDLDEPVEPREPVVTAGVERAIMPPGMAIPIGIVDRVTPDEANRVQIVEVAYSVDFNELSVVQVLRWVPES